MIRFPDDVDSDEFLDVLQQALDPFVVEKQYMSRAEYTAVFMAVCRFQGRPQPTRAEMANAAQSTAIRLPPSRDQQLYDWIIDYTDRAFSKLAVQMRQLSGFKLLESYIDEWKHFQRMHRLVGRLFYKVDQNWVERERRYNPSCTTVSSTLIQLWYACLFKPISTHLMANAFERSDIVLYDTSADNTIIARLCKALTELSPEGMDGLHGPYRKDLGVYIYYYENPYIAATIARFNHKVCELRMTTNMLDYVAKLPMLLEEEENRGKLLLSPESHITLKNALVDRFVVPEIDQIYELAEATLRFRGSFILGKIYWLLKRADKTDLLQKLREGYMSNAENDIMRDLPQRPADAASDDHKFTLDAIEYLASQLNSLEQIIKEEFSRDPGYIAALAEYCSLILERSKPKPVGFVFGSKRVAQELRKAMCVVNAYTNKAEFFDYYRQQLARRLLNSAGFSVSKERAAISVIYEATVHMLDPDEMASRKAEVLAMLAKATTSK
ncbi:ubiquitin ligase (cullin) of SCF [Coemansia sp. RSA 2611]|nr:ubiquitin ligase (cullin) of SCF [Coemansia sp. RSA 2611]